MDLNYLYQRHQVSLFMPVNAANQAARASHLSLSHAYAARIAALRESRQSAAA